MTIIYPIITKKFLVPPIIHFSFRKKEMYYIPSMFSLNLLLIAIIIISLISLKTFMPVFSIFSFFDFYNKSLNYHIMMNIK